MNKFLTKIATFGLGMIMAIGVGVAAVTSDGFTRVSAAEGALIKTYKSDDVVSNSAYQTYSNDDAIVTFGGNNNSIGVNSKNRSKCTLSNHTKYAVAPVTTTQIASAFVSKTSISNVGKVSYSFNGGSNQTSTNVYLIYSKDGTTFSQMSLVSGSQGHTIQSGSTFTFETCGGYFGLLFEATNSTGNWRIDYVEFSLFEGETSSGGDSSESNPVLTSLSLTLANEQDWYVGDIVTKDDLLLTAIYDNDSANPVNITDYSFTDVILVEGDNTISVTYGEMDATLVIEALPLPTPEVGESYWGLLKNSSLLKANDKVIIAATGYDVAMSTTQNSNNRGQISIIKSGDNILNPSSSVEVFTVEEGTKDNTFAFKSSSGYIYAASAGSNYLRTEATKSDNSSWTVEVSDDGTATLLAQGTNTRNWLRYNNTNSIFSCYGSGQSDICLYKYFEVIADDKVLNEELLVTGSLVKTNYTNVETFNPSGLTIYATFTDSSAYPNEDITDNIQWSTLEVGSTSVVGTYTLGEMQATCTIEGITVTAAKGTIENPFTVTEAIAKVDEYGKDKIEDKKYAVIGKVTSFTYNATYSNSEIIITDGTNTMTGFRITGASTDPTNEKYVAVNHTVILVGVLQYYSTNGIYEVGETGGDQYLHSSVAPELGEIESIVISTNSTHKTEYIVGDSFTTNGLILTATDTNGLAKEILDGFETNISEGTILETVGLQTIIITYLSFELSYDITVIEPTGLLENGRYFISTTNGALEAREYTNSTSTKVTIDTTAAWTFTLVGENTYTISNIIEGKTFYLSVTNNSNGLRTTEDAVNWILESVEGGYTLMSYETDDDGSARYLCDYTSDTKNDWRTYASSAASGKNTLQITEEKVVFSQNLLNIFTNGCDPDGIVNNITDEMWSNAAKQFATLSDENKTIWKEVVASEEGDILQQATARYDYIVGKYSYVNFAERPLTSVQINNTLLALQYDNSKALLYVVITLLTVTGATIYFSRKRREENAR